MLSRKGLMSVLKIFALSLCLLLAPVSALASDCPLQLADPVLLTSLGQSLDALIVKTIFDEMKVRTDFLPLASADVVAGYEQVIISPGISYKGIGAAGMTVEAELERARSLVDVATENSIPIILMYLGGFLQGDAKSQLLLEILTPEADLMIVYKDCGGPMEYFRRIAEEKGIPLHVIENLGNLAAELSCIVSQ